MTWAPRLSHAGCGGRVERTEDCPQLLTGTEAKAQEEKFSKFRSLAAKPGDAALGQKLFTVTCAACHNVGGHGGQIGPVLNGAGAMGPEALLRAVLTPNAAMEAGYRTFRVELLDGDIVDGRLISQDNEGIVLGRPNAEDLHLKRANVRRAAFTKTSLMPEGLLESLPTRDVTDLFAYLQTLK